MRILNADEIYNKIVDAGEDWSDKDAAATLLEETKKCVMAELFIAQPATLSIAVREYVAQADPTYKLHVTNMVAARKAANHAKVKFEAAKLLAELRRSQESSRRAEMNLR